MNHSGRQLFQSLPVHSLTWVLRRCPQWTGDCTEALSASLMLEQNWGLTGSPNVFSGQKKDPRCIHVAKPKQRAEKR